MNDFEILGEALAIPDPKARGKYLDQACGDDASLRARLEAMLASEGLPSVFVGVPISQGSAASQTDPLLGQSIGGVKLVRVISEGGMGLVYEGRQETPRRTVAVKLVKPGVATDKLLRRFEFEAQVLARLSHPGIAQIFAAGAEGEGRDAQPYFVMEYVAGAKPITQYADHLQLSNQARLSLFQKVCDAVAYGHQKGIIHRDLKPGNILVNAAGEPKVIDFGIAKTTDSDMALTTMQTDVGRLIGTYQYMSPEQFDADPHAIDVRSDVYALGVVLYELLTGKPPYELQKRVLPEIATIVRQQEPTPITSVNKTLRRDVGIIAGKCLEKDKTRRYSSASELAADIGRYLAGDPIAAVAPSFVDGVLRLAKKHKAAAAAVASTAASLVAAMVGISVFALRAERLGMEARGQKDVAKNERDRAEAALAIAEKETSDKKAALERVQAESAATKRHLYAASLYKLDANLDRPNRRFASEILNRASTLFREAYPDSTAPPIELGMIRSTLDDAVVILEGHEQGVRSVAASPSGALLATASDDHTARLWDAASGRLLFCLTGHSAPVVRLAFSPDGTRLATASEDSTARIWDTADGRALTVLKGHGKSLTSLAFSPDGRRLATGSVDESVRLWDIPAGTSRVLPGDRHPIVEVIFSPNGNRLATLGHSVRIWDVSTGRLETVISHPELKTSVTITSFAFSPDGGRGAAGAADNTAHSWDAETGQRLAMFGGDTRGIVAIAYSPDGSMVATGSLDRTVCFWDAATGGQLATLTGHTQEISGLAFLPDGKRLATASRDGSLRLWRVPSGDSIAVLRGHEAPITSLVVMPDGKRVVTGASDGTARVWDGTGGRPSALAGPKEVAINCIGFSPDGRRLATGTFCDALRIWDCRSAELLATFPTADESIEAVAFSPDGSILAAAGQSGATEVRDTRTGELIASLPGEKSWCWAGYYHEPLAFSPDGTRLITAPDANTARVWEVATGKLVAVLGGHNSQVMAVAYSPDGKRVATGDLDGSIQLWDATTLEPTASFSATGGGVNLLAFSPDSCRLAASTSSATTETGVAVCWDVATGESLSLEPRHYGEITSLSYSADGRFLATSWTDGTARISDASGRAVAHLEGHEGRVRELTFSPDSKRAVTVSSDDTARLWLVATGELLAVLRGHSKEITSVSFSPDGTRLATGSLDGTARLWGLSNAEIHSNRLAAAERRVRLSPVVDEWFSDDLAAVKASLAAAKATLPPDDWHEASNMVLERASRPTASPLPEAEASEAP